MKFCYHSDKRALIFQITDTKLYNVVIGKRKNASEREILSWLRQLCECLNGGGLR